MNDRQQQVGETLTDTRLTRRLAAIKDEGRGALVTFITGGDPDPGASLALVKALPKAGADIIEIGMPFSDPMADGPAIQAANRRALAAGMTLTGCLELVRDFRKGDTATPIILMGYFNPIFSYGAEAFSRDAKEAGADGLIIVDLPPEEDSELCAPALAAGLHWIRLATPTTDEARLAALLRRASGFLYYVSVAGTTGGKSAGPEDLRRALSMIRAATELPVMIGFGIKTAEQVGEAASLADGAVVGSALVEIIRRYAEAGEDAPEKLVASATAFVQELAAGARN